MNAGITAINEEVERASAFVQPLLGEMGKVVIGQKMLVERLIIGLLANGHVLLEGVPGLAKTLAIKSLSESIAAEFSRIPHDRGTLGAARSANPNSANSQFFINFKDNHFLNGQYTVYGRVISGMEHVDKITRGEPPANPDKMISMKVAADA